MAGLVRGEDGLLRCAWASSTPDYVAYHDTEWGRPVHGDRAIYERLTLEGFQAGLSWITILRKREHFRRAFAGFEPALVASFDEADRQRLLGDAGIVRHAGKIDAAIGNARALVRWQEAEGPGCLEAFWWSYAQVDAAPVSLGDIPAVTTQSTQISRELKRRGFRFVGPTTMYAAMQACGLVNDHLVGCISREAAAGPTSTR